MSRLPPIPGSPPRLAADPRRGALLVIDVQRGFCDPTLVKGVDAEAFRDIRRAVARISRLIDVARRFESRVIFVRLERGPETEWVASNWLRGRPSDSPPPCARGSPGTEYFGVAPRLGDIEVVKPRYSAFMGTNLAISLRALRVQWLVLCGITTDCCVESTARDAFQLDFPVFIAADACAAYTRSRHEAALETMAANCARVVEVRDITRHRFRVPEVGRTLVAVGPSA